jgi:hypothetical protein
VVTELLKAKLELNGSFEYKWTLKLEPYMAVGVNTGMIEFGSFHMRVSEACAGRPACTDVCWQWCSQWCPMLSHQQLHHLSTCIPCVSQWSPPHSPALRPPLHPHLITLPTTWSSHLP